MYTYPLHCQNQRTASQARTSRPSQAAARHSVEQDLKVAEEKCNALSSTAKDACMAAAKAKFGKL